MRIVPADRIEVRIDPEAEPSDWDAALAKFLLAFVQKQATRSAETAAAAAVDHEITSAGTERR